MNREADIAYLCQSLKSSPVAVTNANRKFNRWTIHLYLSILARSCIRKIGNIIEAIELEKSLLAVSECNSGAFLDEMSSKTIDASLGELLAACLASMLVSVTRIVELGTSLKVLENQSYVESVSDLEHEEDVASGWSQTAQCAH